MPAGKYLIEYGESHRKLNIISGGNYHLELDPLNTIELTAGIKNTNSTENMVTIEVEADGKGAHNLNIRVFNGTVAEPIKSVDLGDGNKKIVNWDLDIGEKDSPWVCVIIPDDDLTWKKELTGTFEAD
jgi:hypothetical protein